MDWGREEKKTGKDKKVNVWSGQVGVVMIYKCFRWEFLYNLFILYSLECQKGFHQFSTKRNRDSKSGSHFFFTLDSLIGYHDASPRPRGVFA